MTIGRMNDMGKLKTAANQQGERGGKSLKTGQLIQRLKKVRPQNKNYPT